jgi:hypothetical protein
VPSLKRLPPRDTVADDELDTEGHRLATNDNETVVNGARRVSSDAADDLSLNPSARWR